MGQNIIELGFDVEKLTEEKKQVLDLFVDLFGKLEQYDGTKFNPLGNGGLVELRKSINDGANAMAAFGEVAQKYNAVVTEQYNKQRQAKKSTDDLTLATKAYQNITDQLAQTQAKSNAASSDAASGLAVEREALRQRNSELAAAAKAQLAEAGSVAEARAQISLLKLERDKLNASDEKGAERLKEINALIDKNNQFINENTAKIEQQKNNVGNYAGSLAPAFDAVSERLETIKKELADIETRGQSSFKNFGRTVVQGFGANQHQNQGQPSAGNTTDLLSGSGNQISILNQDTEATQKLVLEQKILEQSQQRQAVGFKTANQEMRNLKNTLDALKIAGLDNTEVFEKLNVAYTGNEQKLKDLHREQAILTTDAPALTALTGVAKGIGGAYAIAAGGAAIFATGNEKVDKELQRLVAIMTFLQGLEEAVSALKERNAIVTALQASATKALNAVRQIEVAIFGQETAAVEANTIATEANAEAQEASAVGLEATGIAAEATTGALEGVTIAEEAGAVGAITFRTALISTGIGAIVIALVYGVTKLIGAIGDWINADSKAIETAKALAEANKELFDLNQKLNEIYEDGAIRRLNSLEKVDAAIKASGKNQFIQLDNERRIAEQSKQIAQDELSRLGVTDSKRAELQSKQKSNSEVLLDLQKDVVAATAKGDKDEIEKAQKKYDANKAVFDLFETKYATVFKLVKDLDDADNKLNVNTITTAKAGADQLEKIAADSAQRRYAIEKDAADRTLNDPRSSFSKREAAISAGYKAEETLAGQHVTAIREQVEKQAITEEDGANQIANIQSELNLKYKKAVDDRVKLRIEERDRNITAQNGVDKNTAEADAAIQEAITKDVQRELEARLTALKANIDDRTKIINADYQTQLKLAKDSYKTEAEIAQLTSDRDKQLVALTADTQKQIYDIVTSYGERKLKAIEDQNKAGGGSNKVTENYNAEVDALNKALIVQKISYSAYVRDKQLLDEKYRIDKDKAEIAEDEAALKRLKDFEEKELQIKINAARAQLIASAIVGNASEIANAQAKANALLAIQTKANADDAAATAKLNKDKQQLNTDTVESTIKGQQILAERIAEIEQQSFEIAKTLVDSSYENRINKIQVTMDKQDAQTENEVSAIQRSALSQRDAAQEVIILQSRQTAQDTAFKNEQKKEKIAEAKFDRDVAIAEVAWNTAKAIMKDTAGIPFPLSLAIVAADAALGAVQIATILARPIPTYAEGIGISGKGIHPGGYAVAGEAGPELVSIPGRQSFVLDKPTLIDLPVNSSVQPLDVSDLTYGVGAAAMQWQSAIMAAPSKESDAWAIARWQSVQMRKAIRANQQKIINKIEVHVDADWTNYLATKVTGIR